MTGAAAGRTRARGARGGPSWTVLIWLDLHLLANRIRSVARNPRRYLIWMVVVGLFVISVGGRLGLTGVAPQRSQRSQGLPPGLVAELSRTVAHAAWLVPGLALLLAGLVVWRSASRPLAAFQSPADGRFLIGAGLSPRAVLLYLSVRTLRRFLLAALFYGLLFYITSLPKLGLSVPNGLAGLAALLIYALLIFGLQALAFVMGGRVGITTVQAVGAAIAAVGALAAAEVAAALAGGGQPGLAVSLPPGAWIVLAFQGQVWVLLPLAAIACLLIGLGIGLAGDCYPELWQASTRLFALRRALRGGGGLAALLEGRREARRRDRRATGERDVRSVSGRSVPAGAWTLAWKEWLTIQRRRGGLVARAAILAAAIALGGGLGWVGRHGPPGVAAGGAGYLLLMAAALASAANLRMAGELRNPLWWLSAASVRNRLVVTTATRSLEFGVPAALLLGMAAAVAGQPAWIPAAILLALTVALLLRAIGLSVYSLLPATTDRRLRQMGSLFGFYLALIPVGIASVPGLVLQSPAPIAVIPSLVAVAEAWLGISLAARRIEGNGLAIALEERR